MPPHPIQIFVTRHPISLSSRHVGLHYGLPRHKPPVVVRRLNKVSRPSQSANMSTKFNMQNQFDYAIIGGGCFGVSTALALQIEQPNAKIILFEGSETKTASKGFWKTIRVPYMDEEYVPLAEESKQKWRTKRPYCKFYRPNIGWVQAVRGDSYKPFHSKERSIKAEDLSDMVRSRDPPQLDSGEELWLNEDIGVAHSTLAVEAVAAEAAVQGVVRQQKKVSKILIKDGVCYGVECVEGITTTAETIIVAAGPWTLALLKSSNIQLPQGDFFCVTAIGVAILPLDEDEYERFKSMPILIAQPGTPKSFKLNYKFLTCHRRSNASNCSAKGTSN